MGSIGPKTQFSLKKTLIDLQYRDIMPQKVAPIISLWSAYNKLLISRWKSLLLGRFFPFIFRLGRRIEISAIIQWNIRYVHAWFDHHFIRRKKITKAEDKVYFFIFTFKKGKILGSVCFGRKWFSIPNLSVPVPTSNSLYVGCLLPLLLCHRCDKESWWRLREIPYWKSVRNTFNLHKWILVSSVKC